MLDAATTEWVLTYCLFFFFLLLPFFSAYKDEKTKHFTTHGHPLSDASRRAFEGSGGVEKGLPHCLSPGALSLACESAATWTAMSAEEYDWMLRATFYRYDKP